MLACLPMYDLRVLRAATDAWWQGLARALRTQGIEGVPEGLQRGEAAGELARREALLIGQCCGYDLVRNGALLQAVATPCYDSPHCAGPEYCSVIVVAEDNAAPDLAGLRDRTCVINGRASHSGYTALRQAVAPLAAGQRFFAEVLESGSHPASLEWIRKGRADCTSVDCVTYALLLRHLPEAVQGLKVLTTTERAPGLPYVTAATAGPDLLARLRAGLAEALELPDLAAVRKDLLIAGFEVLPTEAYERIREMEAAADAQSYPAVA